MSSKTKANNILIDLFDELSTRMHGEAHVTLEHLCGRGRTLIIAKDANGVTVRYMLYVGELLEISDYPESSIRVLMDNGSACDPEDTEFDPDDYRDDIDVSSIDMLADDVQKYIDEHLDADSKKRYELPQWLRDAPKNQWFEHDGEPTIVGDDYRYGTIDDGRDTTPLADLFAEDDGDDDDNDRFYAVWCTRRAGSCHMEDKFHRDLYHSQAEAKKAVEAFLGL